MTSLGQNDPDYLKVPCDAALHPFPGTDELRCEMQGPHRDHQGHLRNYAYPGSSTVITWQEADRRTYHGDWPGECKLQDGCILPGGHHGRHAT